MASEQYLVEPKAVPNLDIPKSSATVDVSVVDQGLTLTLPMSIMMKKQVGDKESATCPAYVFLIEHSSGQKLLFDLGVRRDVEGAPPSIQELYKMGGMKMDIPRELAEALDEQSIARDSINAIIWSHHHWDHVGKAADFPTSTSIVVGPGFKQNHLPGYPSKQDSQLLDSDLEGREVREINFEKDAGATQVGPFKALDYFGDGSFYILNTPGHTVGHVCALARTSASPPAFVYMGGDVVHHGGEFRPSPYVPLPKSITPSPFRSCGQTCPGELLLKIHPKNSATEPFYDPSDMMVTIAEENEKSTAGTVEFDAQANVVVIFAHDNSLRKTLPYLPQKLNGWEKDGKLKGMHWAFLAEFENEKPLFG